MTDSPYVFISYSSTDRAFASKLAGDLEAYGIKVWWDHHVNGIPFAEDWEQVIQGKLRECTHLIVIMTPASVKSTMVKAEIQTAVENGKILIPLLLDDVPFIPLQLKPTQYLDIRNPNNYHEDVEQIAALITGKLTHDEHTESYDAPKHVRLSGNLRFMLIGIFAVLFAVILIISLVVNNAITSTNSANTAIAQGIQNTQTAVAASATEAAARRAAIAASRTESAASADKIRTQGAGTLQALADISGTTVASAPLPASYYTNEMVYLLDSGYLSTITGKIDFHLTDWQSTATGNQTTTWDQWLTKPYTDYVMGVRFKWGTDVAKDGCGIVAHVSTQSLYSFAIDHTGTFKWQTINYQDQTYVATKDKTAHTDAINTDVNTMVLVVHGDTYHVIVNNQLETVRKALLSR